MRLFDLFEYKALLVTWAALLSVLSLLAYSTANASTFDIDTTSAWDSVQGLSPFGDWGIETFGQTFISPEDSRLDRIAFYLNDLINGDATHPVPVSFKAYVMAWDDGKAAGPILFESEPLVSSNNFGLDGMERFEAATGGVELEEGRSYVFFISVTGLAGVGDGMGYVGFLSDESGGDAYAGGEFVGINSQKDPSRWTEVRWDKPFLGNDMAFTLTFAPSKPPSISNAADLTVSENQSLATDVQASDADGDVEGGGLVFSLSGGVDRHLFAINAETGLIRFKSAPDFENPMDGDANNAYEVEATVTDSSGRTDQIAFVIRIEDVTEGSFASSLELIPFGSTWSYQDDRSDLYSGSTPFYSDAFDDGAWKEGEARFGFGGDGEATSVDSANRQNAVYFRKHFTFDAASAEAFEDGLLSIYADDGAVVYLNGMELRRFRMPGGDIGFQTPASTTVEGLDERTAETFEFAPSLIRDGENLIAVSLHNSGLSDGDLGFDMRLALTRRIFSESRVLDDSFREHQIPLILDLNNDGTTDILYTRDGQDDQIRYRLQLGNGQLGPVHVIEADFDQVNKLLAEDLDGDGRVDVIGAAPQTPGRLGIRIYRNMGSEFAETQRFEGFDPRDLVLADLDGDGHLDLVYQEYGLKLEGASDIVWRRNDGSGRFLESQSVAISGFVGGLAAADLDRDGDLDLAAAIWEDGQIFWIENGGSGDFSNQRLVSNTLSEPRAIAAGDMDGDFDVDLVAAGDGATLLFRNKGAGEFGEPWVIDPDAGVRFINLADLDQDGDLDLVRSANNRLEWRENDGKGDLSGSRLLTDDGNESVTISGLAYGDYNGDGRTDLVAVVFGTGAIKLFQNLAVARPDIDSFRVNNREVDPGEVVTLAWETADATEVLLNGEPVAANGFKEARIDHEDVIFTLTARNPYGEETRTVSVFIREALFGAARTLKELPIGDIQHLSTGDLDGNGTMDLVPSDYSFDTLAWTLNLGGAVFSDLVNHEVYIPELHGTILADLDEDGDLDIVAYSWRYPLVWFENLGGGVFGSEKVISSVGGSLAKAADLNADGHVDLVVEAGFGFTKALSGDGKGHFNAPTLAGHGKGVDLEIEDLTGDGILDLLNIGGSSLTLYPGDEPLSFPYDRRIIIEFGLDAPVAIEVADFTGDGILDIVPTERSNRNVKLLKGLGQGQFQTDESIASIENKSDSVHGDFDGDGDLDLAFLTNDIDSSSVVWLENDGAGNFRAPQSIAEGEWNALVLIAGDIDGDGDLDFIVAGRSNAIVWIPNESRRLDPPVIRQFDADKARLHRGESATLRWSVEGAAENSIDPGIGNVLGISINVSPSESTEYTFSASNSAGAVEARMSLEVVDRPVIHSFTADLMRGDEGAEVILAWEAAGAERLSLLPGVGEVQGNSISLPLRESAVFTLTAVNAFGEDVRETRVEFTPDRFRLADVFNSNADYDHPKPIAAGDIDRDGCDDIVGATGTDFGSLSGALFWISADGNGSFNESRVIQLSDFGWVQGVALADFDDDGWLDVASTSNDGSGDGGSWVNCHRNLESKNWEGNLVDENAPDYRFIEAADVDGDSKTDIILGSPRGILVWHRNMGGFQFAPSIALSAELDDMTAIRTADLDQDGDVDLAVSMDRDDAAFGWLENLGGGDFSTFQSLIELPIPRIVSFDLGDVNKDGFPDAALATQFNNGFYLFFNDGSPSFKSAVHLDLGGSPSYMVVDIEDLDLDGDLDVLHGGKKINWSENLGGGAFRFRPMDFDSRMAYRGLAAGDFDCDGDPDYAVHRDTGNEWLGWIDNQGTSSHSGIRRTNEDAPILFQENDGTQIVLPEFESENVPIQLSLSVEHGALTLGGSNGLIFDFEDQNGAGMGTGTGDEAMTFRGFPEDVRRALNGLRYASEAAFSGKDALSVAVSVLTNSGEGHGLAETRKILLLVSSVSDPPNGTDQELTLLRNQSYVFQPNDFGFTDPNDSPPDDFSRLMITTLPEAGVLALNNVPVDQGDFIIVADIEQGALTFDPALDEFGDSYASFDFQVEDDGTAADGGANLDPSPNTIVFHVSEEDYVDPFESIQPFVWEARNGESTVYLVGSIHYLREEDYPLHPKVNEVYEKAEQVYLEINPDNENEEEFDERFEELAFYPPGDSIRNHLAPGDYDLLADYFADNDLFPPDPLRPWFINLIIRDIELEKSGFRGDLGVDNHFKDRAEDDGKPIRGLETSASQLDVLSFDSDEEEIADMVFFLRFGDLLFIEGIREVAEEWMTGDYQSVAEGNQSLKERNPEYYDKVLVERNLNWLPQIEALLNSGLTSLVVVGVGHMPGEEGLIALLEDRGYAVGFYPLSAPDVDGPPIINSEPGDLTVYRGQDAVLSVQASGSSALGYQWYLNNVNLPGETDPELRLDNVQPFQSGEYFVIVTDAEGQFATSRGARLTVVVPEAPTIVEEPQDAELVWGDSVVFTVAATGEAPLHYQWHFNGEPLAGENNDTLTLADVTTAHEGVYSVSVDNVTGNTATSRPAGLTVALPPPPLIESQPADAFAETGGSARFEVRAIGVGSLAYQWHYNGEPLAGETNSVLELRDLTVAQSGNYHVTISNPGETPAVSEVASLTVEPPRPPIIVAQPLDVVAQAGGTAQLTVEAAGSEPMAYQWFYEDQVLNGETNDSLILDGSSLNQTGFYHVAIENAYGLAISETAIFMVDDPASPPANDLFANRAPIQKNPIRLAASNFNAGRETGEPAHSPTAGGQTVWWSWTAPRAADAIVDTEGSHIDTALAVYEGDSLGSLSLVAANDDAPGGGAHSRLEFQARAGVEYQIAVDGFADQTGIIVLSFEAALTRPGIQYEISGRNLILSWPSQASGFHLETTDRVESENWSRVEATPAVLNENYILKLPMETGRRFYRLKED